METILRVNEFSDCAEGKGSISPPLVPGTPTNKQELFDELRRLVEGLRVVDVLRGYGMAVYELTGKEKGADSFLMVLDPVEKTVDVTAFAPNQILAAEEQYLRAEKSINRQKGMQAVLVSVESVTSLKRAYPNYFLDTDAFLDALALATAK